MAIILSGEDIANRLLVELKEKMAGKNLCLAVVQVGENVASNEYVAKKEKTAVFLGVKFKWIHFDEDIVEANLVEEIEKLGRKTDISGMIVQLPLPQGIDTKNVLNAIPKEKDVDVLSAASFGEYALGSCKILPPTVGAVDLLLQEAGVSVRGKNVALVGTGRLVGLPLLFWLLRQGATVCALNKDTKDLTLCTKNADVVISGVGKAGLITGSMVKKGAVVIDAGTSVAGSPSTRSARSGRQASLAGDVDFKSVSKKASFITPVPGGVGPLTVACLFHNLLSLYGK